MAYFLQNLTHQNFSGSAQKPENIPFPNVNYGIQNSDAGFNPEPLNLKVPRPIWRPYEVTSSNFALKISESGEAPDKKEKRKKFILPSHISLGKDEKSGETLYNCTICTKSFKTKAHVKYHKFCSGEKKPFKCGDCQMEFITKSHSEYHLRTHTGEKPYYACSICDKTFNQKWKLTCHMLIHTEEKPYICRCGRGFSNAQALKTHNLVHTGPGPVRATGERPFACLEPGCGKRFTEPINLKKHKITHRDEINLPFPCSKCSKSFGFKWILDLHEKTHIRPHICDVCKRSFTNKKDLLRHSIIHTNKRPYECEYCGLTSRRKDNLVRHIQAIHNVRFDDNIHQL